MKTLLTILALLIALPVSAQMSCVQTGAFTSCDGPRGQSFDQLQLNRNQGVITDSKGHLEPYTILPPRPEPMRPLTEVLPRSRSLETPRSPVAPYSSFEAPSAPVFLYGTGEAGQ